MEKTQKYEDYNGVKKLIAFSILNEIPQIGEYCLDTNGNVAQFIKYENHPFGTIDTKIDTPDTIKTKRWYQSSYQLTGENISLCKKIIIHNITII